MLGLPASTEFNRRVSKQKILATGKISAALEKNFSAQVESIHWRNKIFVKTLNLAKGNYVDEINIIEVQLRAESLDEKILRSLVKAIPNHIIFVLSRDGLYRLCAAFQDGSLDKNFFYTDWTSEDELTLCLNGLTLDEVYENFIRQILGAELSARSGESLRDFVERYARMKALDRKVNVLRRKIRSEKQFNRRLEMNGELKILLAELERLIGGSVG